MVLIADCHPTIPRGTRIVLTNVIGDERDTSVLVKAGGTYTYVSRATIYVEPGGVVKSGEGFYRSLIYMMNGSSQQVATYSPADFVLGPDVDLGPTDDSFDTVRCSDLSFDYSQLTSGVANTTNMEGELLALYRHEVAWTGPGSLSIEVLSLLGQIEETMTIDRDHPVSLEALPHGIYIIHPLQDGVRSLRVIR
jgi:hypothetical protein